MSPQVVESNPETQTYGQLLVDYETSVQKIQKSKGTILQVMRVNTDTYTVQDLSTLLSPSSSSKKKQKDEDPVADNSAGISFQFDVPTSHVKLLEFTELPTEIQHFLLPSMKKKKLGLFSRFRKPTIAAHNSANSLSKNEKISQQPLAKKSFSEDIIEIESDSSALKYTMDTTTTTTNTMSSSSVTSVSGLSSVNSTPMVNSQDAITTNMTQQQTPQSQNQKQADSSDLDLSSIDELEEEDGNGLDEFSISSIEDDDEEKQRFTSSSSLQPQTPPQQEEETEEPEKPQFVDRLPAESREILETALQQKMMKRRFTQYITKSPEVRNARLRKLALLEILTTEESYYSALKTCQTLFMDPLLSDAQTKKKPILAMNDINEIFGELRNIMQASEMLMNDLKKEIDKWPEHPVLIGNIFKSFAPFFRMYSNYINNFDVISEKVEKLEKSSKNFSAFLTRVYENPECAGLTFTAFLVCPVQRVPRIRMLLQEVLKRTDESHLDYAPIEQALAIVNQVAQNLNESKRNAENDKIMFELQERLRSRFGSILQSHRKYIRRFNQTHVESSKPLDKTKINGTYDAYLFNDMMLLVPSSLNASFEDDHMDKNGSISLRGKKSNSEQLMDEEERKSRFARESFVIYFAFSQVRDREEKEAESKQQQLLSGYTFVLNTFVKSQNVKLTFGFNAQLARDEMEAEVTINIEEIDKNMERKVGKDRLKIEKKRSDILKNIKISDMMLSKSLAQKNAANEKLQLLNDKLYREEQALETHLLQVRSLRDEITNQKQQMDDIESKEAKSLGDFEDQIQKIVDIDTTLWKMLNQDKDAFKEIFGEDPRTEINENNSVASMSPNTPASGGSFSGSLNNALDMNEANSPSLIESVQSRKISVMKRPAFFNMSSGTNINALLGDLNQLGNAPPPVVGGAGTNVNTDRFSMMGPITSGTTSTTSATTSGSSSGSTSLPISRLKDHCNPYVQSAYREIRKKTSKFTSENLDEDDPNTPNEEIEVLNDLYRIKPSKRLFMIEPFRGLPHKYRLDRLYHGENTPQEIIPKFLPYPEEYENLDLYYGKISERDGWYDGEEEDEMVSGALHGTEPYRMYGNLFDLPNDINELRSMIVRLEMEKADMKKELARYQKEASGPRVASCKSSVVQQRRNDSEDVDEE